MIEYNRYNSDGSLREKNTYKYDEKGNKIEENNYNDNGSLCWKNTYNYDEKGNVIEENNYNYDGISKGIYTYEYEYDENKNWIQEIKYFNGIAQTIKIRKIEYFE